MKSNKKGRKTMKRKLIPPFLMLFAGAVCSIIMHFNYYETNKMLVILLAVMISFYIAGSLFTMMLNIFDKKNQPEEEVQEEAIEEIVSGEGTPVDMREGQVKTEG